MTFEQKFWLDRNKWLFQHKAQERNVKKSVTGNEYVDGEVIEDSSGDIDGQVKVEQIYLPMEVSLWYLENAKLEANSIAKTID